jgi:hypothetical protein
LDFKSLQCPQNLHKMEKLDINRQSPMATVRCAESSRRMVRPIYGDWSMLSESVREMR